MNKTLFLLFLIIVLPGCSSKSEKPNTERSQSYFYNDLPDEVRDLKNLTVISPDQQPLHTVSITQDYIFTETEEIFFGFAGNIAVDKSGRLFIQIGSEMGQAGVVVFNADGTYLTTLGRYGRGPGEFEVINDLYISNQYLYVFETYRFHIFSLEDLSLSETITLEMDGIKAGSDLRGLQPSPPFFALNDSMFLTKFTSLPRRIKKGTHFNYFAKVHRAGQIDSEWILKEKDFPFYNTTEDGSLPRLLPFAMPFTRSSLITSDNEGMIYAAWNEHFTIKTYNSSGEYLQAIYMPWANADLTKHEAYEMTTKNRTDILRTEGVPETWPAIHSIHADEKNHLWISTITESDSTFLWWIIDDQNRLLAKFQFPGNKRTRAVWHPKDLIIKDGYLYYTNNHQNYKDAAQIIRYKIEFTER